MEIEKAIEYYEKRVAIEKQQAAEYKGLGGEFEVSAPLRKNVLERHEAALSALREQQEREKGTPMKMGGKNPDGTLRYFCPKCGRLFWDKDAVENYCPHCGRRLKEEK